MPTVEEATQMRGMTAVDRDDDKIGKIKDVYLDQDTGQPGWLEISGGLLSSGVNFVPLAQATREGDNVRVPFEKGHVKDAPHAEADGALSQEERRGSTSTTVWITARAARTTGCRRAAPPVSPRAPRAARARRAAAPWAATRRDRRPMRR